MEIVIVKQANMDRATKNKVRERDTKKLCIACGEKPQHKRKACTTCHNRFIDNMPDDEREAAIYEADCIAKGLIAKSRQGQRSDKNPYKDMARKAKSKAKAS